MRDWANVLSQTSVQGFLHLAETLNGTEIYVARIEKGPNLRQLLRTSRVCNFGSRVLGAGAASGEKHVAEVIKYLAGELKFAKF